MIRVTGVSKTYNGSAQGTGTGSAQVRALDNVSFSIDQGEFVALMGPSGGGKSTLLHCLGGLDSPDSGEIWVDDVCVNRAGDRRLTELRRTRVGYVFQFFNLLPTLSLRDNVTLPLLLGGALTQVKRDLADRLIEEVGLAERAHHLPSELSGGQMQRAALARALVIEPALILADEPTGNLDSASSAQVVRLFRDLCHRYKTTVVVATHSRDVAGEADRILSILDGRLEGGAAS